MSLAERLAALPQKPQPVLGLLNSRLPGASVCLLTADGNLPAGRSPAATPGSGGRTEMRLVAYLSGAADAWADTVATALGLAAGPITAWAAVERLGAERDARLRGTLLAELLAGTDTTGERIAAQVARPGRQPEGWHTGIYLSLSGPTDQETLVARTSALTEALAAAKPQATVVERTDGWSAWIDHPEKPAPRAESRLAETLRELLVGRPGRFTSNTPMTSACGRCCSRRSALRTSVPWPTGCSACRTTGTSTRPARSPPRRPRWACRRWASSSRSPSWCCGTAARTCPGDSVRPGCRSCPRSASCSRSGRSARPTWSRTCASSCGSSRL